MMELLLVIRIMIQLEGVKTPTLVMMRRVETQVETLVGTQVETQVEIVTAVEERGVMIPTHLLIWMMMQQIQLR